MKPKLFLTAGDSYSAVPYFNGEFSWPSYMHKTYFPNATPVHLYKMGCGNGIISRTFTVALLDLIKKYEPEDILVGIMWASSERTEFLHQKSNFSFIEIESGLGYQNPQNILPNYNETNLHRDFFIVNRGLFDEYSDKWYKMFYSQIQSRLITLEHILRTQLLLEKLNIKYFFMSLGKRTLPMDEEINNFNLQHLKELINWNCYIKENIDTFARETELPLNCDDGFHPTGKQNALFCENIIVPHLKERGIL